MLFVELMNQFQNNNRSMKIKYLSVLFFALMSMTSFAQKKEIRIGPGLPLRNDDGGAILMVKIRD